MWLFKATLSILLLLLLLAEVRCQNADDDATAGGGARGEASEDATGYAEESSKFGGATLDEARADVCGHTETAFLSRLTRPDANDMFGELKEVVVRARGQMQPRYVTEKPVETPPNSICTGINHTCCQPGFEKEVLRMAALDYKESYNDAIKAFFTRSSCSIMGKSSIFYDTMFSSLVETQRQLYIEVAEQFGQEFPAGLFDEFFDYLFKFIHFPDLCSLEGVVEAQLEKIFEAAYELKEEQQLSNLDQKSRNCFSNVSRTFVQSYKASIMPQLELQLADLALFIDSLNVFQDILKTVRGHSFSPTCVATAANLQYCAYCGGHTVFKPCLFLCINTFRGCMADITELYPSYTDFMAALRTFSLSLANDLQPEVMVAKSLSHFVTLAGALSRTDISARLSIFGCEISVQPVSRDRRMTLQPSSPYPGTPITEAAISYNLLADAIGLELSCMDELGLFLNSIPEEMCFLSKNPIAANGNTQCWTGTGLGRYDDQVIGRKKADQAENPAFVHKLDPRHKYREELYELDEVTMRLNETNEMIKCLKSGDEDCAVRSVNFTCSDDETPPTTSESGSGNYDCGSGGSGGSGCGSGDSGPVDLEDGDVDVDETVDETPDGDWNQPDHWSNVNNTNPNHVFSDPGSNEEDPTTDQETTNATVPTTGSITVSPSASIPTSDMSDDGNLGSHAAVNSFTHLLSVLCAVVSVLAIF